MKKRIIITLLMGILTHLSAQEVNSANAQITQKYVMSYSQLKQYEGLYAYINNTTLTLAASPIDTILYAIINESRYKLVALEHDLFMDGTKSKIQFFRNKKNEIAGYYKGDETFNILDKKIKSSQEMWYPRLNIPKNYKYVYQQPKNDNDGLETGNLDNTGLDKALLSEMVEKIIDGTYPNVHSILIIKDGKLVFEEYFYDHNKNKLHELRSASKSFISALTGIALEKNYIKSIDEKVLPYFSEYTFKHNLDLKNKITIRNLLTNQSGLDCDVYNAKAVGNESIMAYEKDWIQYSLDLPMIDSAGGIGQYCSSNPIILGRILEKSTKMTLPDFAKQTLFKDLGIKKFVWHFKPDPSSGETFCQLNLRSRDMAKFGLLYLNNGFWNGKQVIQKEWVGQSLAKQTVIAGLDYGYLWWTKYLDADGVRYYGKLAQGNGGQKIYIFKELNLVTVITAGHYNMQSSSNELNAKYILPAFNKK
jgi:CubicO group peptidase (beta-lactamase class C family)